MNIEWDDLYSLGNERIDQQHKELFQLAGVVMTAEDQAGYRIAAILLYKHLRVHFADEEALMREVKYPSVQEHCQIHLGMVTRLNEISKTIGQGEWDKAAIASFMTEWVAVHIMQEDYKVACHIRQLAENPVAQDPTSHLTRRLQALL